MRLPFAPRPMAFPLLLLLFLHSLLHRKAIGRRRKCPGSLSEDKIVRGIFQNYTKRLPDSDHGDESVHVEIEMHVQDMGSLNEISADFEIDVLFTQIWHDPALSFVNLSSECVRNITMESRYLRDIWTPNTCIINAKRTSVHASPTDNIMFILYENGTIWTNHRLSVKAPCALDLRTFPFDTQTCELLLESYSHNNEEVTLHWMVEPITMMKVIQLPDFDMIQFDTKRVAVLYPNGYWDELQARFTFKRRYGFYILQAYVPTYLTIIVSWVGFCMEPKALPARTTVGVSSLLALTLQFGNIHKNLPRVSYVKAMDVWMLGCISFVFGTMIELAIVCFITRCQSSRRRRSLRRGTSSASLLSSHPLSSFPRRSLSVFRPPSSCCAMDDDLSGPKSSILEANLMEWFNAQRSSRHSSMRGHGVRNGTVPTGNGRRTSGTIGGGGGGGTLPRRRRRPSDGDGSGKTGGRGKFSSVRTRKEAEERSVISVLIPATPPPQLLAPPTVGNGELPTSPICKSVSAAQILNANSGGRHSSGMDRRSVSTMPEQLCPFPHSSSAPPPSIVPTFRPSVCGRRRSSDAEENWPIIQPESIDKLSIVVFPLAFTLFNLIYWWYYLLSLGAHFDRDSGAQNLVIPSMPMVPQ